MTQPRRATATQALLWTVVSAAVFVAAPFVLLPVLADAQNLLGVPHFLARAVWVLGWGLLAVLGVHAAGSAIFDSLFRARAVAWALAAAGIGLAALVQATVHVRSVLGFGYYDPEFSPTTSMLFAVVLALTVGAFGVLSAPREARMWPAIPALGMGVTALAIVAIDVPGARNGIRPESWPLAIVLGCLTVYALATVAISVRLILRQPSA